MTKPESLDIGPEHWRIVASILAQRLPDAEIWAFGSRVTGKAGPYSDLDLLVYIPGGVDLALRGVLEEDFCESILPFNVDIVDGTEISDSFRTAIARTRILVNPLNVASPIVEPSLNG